MMWWRTLSVGLEEIQEEFNDTVAFLVDGVSKINRIESSQPAKKRQRKYEKNDCGYVS